MASVRRSEQGIELRRASVWLRGQRLAHPRDPELARLVIWPHEDTEICYFRFLEGLTARLVRAREERQAADGLL